MAQTELNRRMSLSLSAKNRADKKGQSLSDSALSSASCRRSGRSLALPYPPHECPQFTTAGYPPLAEGTSLLCRIGDISTLH